MKIKSRAVLRTLIEIPAIIVVYLLQATVFSRVSIFGAKPLLLPLAVVALAFSAGSVRGGFLGLFAGILCDVSFNQPAIEFTLALTVVGISVGLLAETSIAKNYTSYLICSAGTLVFCALWQSVSFIIFRGSSFVPLFSLGLRQALSSLIFTLPVYYLFRLIDREA